MDITLPLVVDFPAEPTPRLPLVFRWNLRSDSRGFPTPAGWNDGQHLFFVPNFQFGNKEFYVCFCMMG